MDGSEHITVELDLRFDGDTVAGVVRTDGFEREFVGWLGLLGELDLLARSGAPGPV